MKKFFAIALVAAVTLFQTNALAVPVANYDSATGNITFDIDPAIVGIDFKSAGGNLVAANANDLGAIFDNSLAPGTLSWLNFGTLSGTLDAGNIVAPGTDILDLTFEYIVSLGTQPVVGDILGGGGGATADPASGADFSFVDAFLDGSGLIANAVTVSGGSITGLVFGGPDAGLFSAVDNGGSVDITLDVAAALAFPTPRALNATLQVQAGSDNFDYTLSGVVPEPATLSLIGLALVGFVGTRRRS